MHVYKFAEQAGNSEWISEQHVDGKRTTAEPSTQSTTHLLRPNCPPAKTHEAKTLTKRGAVGKTMIAAMHSLPKLDSNAQFTKA